MFEAMQAENKKLGEKVSELSYKYKLLQENYEVILGRIQRVHHMESVMQQRIEEVDRLRVDLTTINEIKMRYRKIQAAYQ
jgi:hypothetical protein